MKQERKAVTLKDIAEKINVSVTTVSRVINHNDTSICSEETQQLIWKLSEELGYISKKNGNSVRSGTIKMGYVLGNSGETSNDPYHSQIVRGIEAEALRNGISLSFSCFSPELYDPDSFGRLVEESEAQAVIYVAAIGSPIWKRLMQMDIPVIIAGIEQSSIPEGMDYVGINFYQETFQWLQMKVAGRYKSAGYIGPTFTGRYKAFLHALTIDGKEPDQRHMCMTGDWKSFSATEAVKRMVERDGLPEVLFAASDPLAIGAMKGLKELGIHVPQDVKLFGFDNIDAAGLISPGLTTIEVPTFNIGRLAVSAALTRLRQERDYSVQYIVTTNWVERETF